MKFILAAKNFFENQNEEQIHDLKKRELVLFIFLVVISAALIAFLASGRNFLTFGNETDFLARATDEAHRLLDGKPLQLTYHPPFYYIILALVELFFHNWFTTGLVISWVSSIIVMVTTFLFFYQIGGRIVAWSSLVGLVTSNLFLSNSASATQDMFFLALYMLCFYLILMAYKKKSLTYWIFAGIVIGLSLLTRTNGLTLLVLLVFPIILITEPKLRLKSFAALLLAILVVLGSWGIAAKVTGSPFSVQRGNLLIGLRYFTTEVDVTSPEARHRLSQKFKSIKDVLLYDPVHLVSQYLKDFLAITRIIFSPFELLAFPFNLFALPAFFILFFNRPKLFLLLLLIATFAQFALVNFTTYEPRYYLFLIPILSAGIGLLIQTIWEKIPKGIYRMSAVLIFLSFLISGMAHSYQKTYKHIHSQDGELSGITAMIKMIAKDGIIVCRKPHIGYYTGNRTIRFPTPKDLEDFRSWLNQHYNGTPIYVYFGSSERHFRPKLSMLSTPKDAPDWLEVVAKSQESDEWVLYKFKPGLQF